MRLLIVEDEIDILQALQRGLKSEGYAVDITSNGEEALELLSFNSYDLMVLDINLPGVDGFSILLTLKEYSILQYLVQNKGRIISSEELISRVWDENADPFTTVIRVHIYSLRKKLTIASGKENLIQTIKGVGYLFGGSKDE